MASIKISLPESVHDYVQARVDRGQYASASEYVRDLISRDQGGVENEQRWLRELDLSVSDTLAEMNAGGSVDLDTACDAACADIGGLQGHLAFEGRSVVACRGRSQANLRLYRLRQAGPCRLFRWRTARGRIATR